MNDKGVFDVVLLVALPASGKSEVRNFMMNMKPEVLQNDFHIGENLQLDDFPYVHLMRRIDEVLVELGQSRIFYPGQNPFIDGRDWATLINLLNEDYDDLMNRHYIKVDSAAKYLFKRIDNAAGKVGIKNRLSVLDSKIYEQLVERLEDEANQQLQDKMQQYPKDFTNKTVIIEMARGGKQNSTMPLSDPFGYQYSFRYLSPELLQKAVILYIWVTPEESRRKNNERANPDDPGSNLFHGVPLDVMINDYGCDDMAYLQQVALKNNTITVNSYGKTYNLPIGVFDNRLDSTSFLRNDPEQWSKSDISNVTVKIKQATDAMFENYNK